MPAWWHSAFCRVSLSVFFRSRCSFVCSVLWFFPAFSLSLSLPSFLYPISFCRLPQTSSWHKTLVSVLSVKHHHHHHHHHHHQHHHCMVAFAENHDISWFTPRYIVEQRLIISGLVSRFQIVVRTMIYGTEIMISWKSWSRGPRWARRAHFGEFGGF